MTRPTRHQWAMKLAQVTALRATCLRRQVGCALLNARGHILATGYNGVAAGQSHCNEVTSLSTGPGLPYALGGTKIATEEVHGNACPGAGASSGTDLDGCHAIHAEQNALLQCQDVYEIDTCYVTTAPCIACTKLLLNTGCKHIIYLVEYAHTHSKAHTLWESSGGRTWGKFEGFN